MGGPAVTELRRARLLERLLGARVAIVEAPSGYGKTTLARQLAAARETASVEVSLAERTSNVDLVRALARACRRAGYSAFAAALADADGGAAQFLAAVRALGEPLLVVVDEMQHLEADTVATLADLVEDLPDGSALVVLGRRRPDAVRALDRRSDAVLLTANDLRLTADDVSRLLRGAHGSAAEAPADTAVIGEVLQVTAGWPAAVAVALAAAAVRADELPSMGAVGRGVMAHLVDTLLVVAHPAAAEAATALAHLPRFDREVAEAAAGPGALALLRDVGVPVLERPDGWLELPDSVRDELVRRRPLALEARRAAAMAYGRRGLLELGVALLQAAPDA